MPTILPNPEQVPTSYHENSDPERKPLMATKVVDVSDRCTGQTAQRCLIYAQDRLGPFVELRWCREDEMYGPHVLYRYSEMGREDWRWQVDSWARCWGIGEQELIQFIYSYAP